MTYCVVVYDKMNKDAIVAAAMIYEKNPGLVECRQPDERIFCRERIVFFIGRPSHTNMQIALRGAKKVVVFEKEMPDIKPSKLMWFCGDTFKEVVGNFCGLQTGKGDGAA